MCNSIGIVTDSNSGITSKEANEWGVTVIPMPFYINGELYYEGLTLNQKEFYKFLEDNLDVNTSQPSPGDVMKNWDEVLKEKEYIIYIPMSSSLSGTYETAVMLAEEYEGKVFVVNNRRISVTQLQSVKDAINLVKKGKSAKEIKEIADDKASYTDWSTRDDIKAELKVAIIITLDENDYPPVPSDEVFKEIFEQAENFKKYA